MEEVNRIGDSLVDGVEKAGQFAIDVDGEIVPLLSFAPGVLDKIQREYGVRWNVIILDPMQRFGVAAELVRQAHFKVGKGDPGELPAGEVLRRFVELPTDVPELPDISDITKDAPEPDPTTAS